MGEVRISPQKVGLVLRSWKNRLTNIFYDHSVVQKILKDYRKIFRSMKKAMDFGYHDRSFGHIEMLCHSIIRLSGWIFRPDSTCRISGRITGYWVSQKARYPVYSYPAKSLSGVSLLNTQWHVRCLCRNVLLPDLLQKQNRGGYYARYNSMFFHSKYEISKGKRCTIYFIGKFFISVISKIA